MIVLTIQTKLISVSSIKKKKKTKSIVFPFIVICQIINGVKFKTFLKNTIILPLSFSRLSEIITNQCFFPLLLLMMPIQRAYRHFPPIFYISFSIIPHLHLKYYNALYSNPSLLNYIYYFTQPVSTTHSNRVLSPKTTAHKTSGDVELRGGSAA